MSRCFIMSLRAFSYKLAWIMASSEPSVKMKLYCCCINDDKELNFVENVQRIGLLLMEAQSSMTGFAFIQTGFKITRMLSMSLDVVWYLVMAELMTRVTDSLHHGKLFPARRRNWSNKHCEHQSCWLYKALEERLMSFLVLGIQIFLIRLMQTQ